MAKSSFQRRKKGKGLLSADMLLGVLAVIAATLIICVLRIKYPDIINSKEKISQPKDDTASVHFIDVGQGDCQLIIADDGTTMLIDAGESEYGSHVLNYIKDLGITRLDYVVGSHPHSDHIGGLRSVIKSDIEIGRVIIPRVADEYIPTTKSYEKLLDAVEDNNLKLSSVKNESFEFGSGFITIIKPDYNEDNYNNYSAVIRFEYGAVSFLFTGDIEKVIERQLVDRLEPIDVNVLKVAHHGSSTSSCYDFLNAVTPEYCVIGCGDNGYNHPNPDVVTRLRSYTDLIYRTDNSGSVVFTTNGVDIKIVTER